MELSAVERYTTENILHAPSLTLTVYVCGEACNLLFNRLCQRLPLGRHAGIDGRSHTCPPSVVGEGVQGWNRRGLLIVRINVVFPPGLLSPKYRKALDSKEKAEKRSDALCVGSSGGNSARFFLPC